LNESNCDVNKYNVIDGEVESNWFSLHQYKNRMFFLGKDLTLQGVTPFVKEQELIEKRSVVNQTGVKLDFRYEWYDDMPESFSGNILQTSEDGQINIILNSRRSYNTPAYFSYSSYKVEVIMVTDDVLIEKIDSLLLLSGL